MTLLDAALTALERGWNVIPVHASKGPHMVMLRTGHAQPGAQGRPVPRWRDFQHERVTETLLREWFHPRWKVPGLAAITGAISNLVVLDFDGVQGQKLCTQWELEPNALSGSGSPHLYFPHPGWPVHNAASGGLKSPPFPGLDVRADGGLIVLPPSHLNNGRYYAQRPHLHEIGHLPTAAAAWTGLSRETAPEVPEWTTKQIISTADIDVDFALQQALKWASGGRDNAGYALARQLQAAGLSQSDAQRVMEAYASHVPQVDSRGRADTYTVRDALRNLQSAYRQPAGRGIGSRRQLSLEERIRQCLTTLQREERQELACLWAGTLLRAGDSDPARKLRDLGLSVDVVQRVQEQLASGVSVRGAAALERFLNMRRQT